MRIYPIGKRLRFKCKMHYVKPNEVFTFAFKVFMQIRSMGVYDYCKYRSIFYLITQNERSQIY